ncbi:MAG: hypothetical protein RXO76_08065 [Vulcanisaeta sp.]
MVRNARVASDHIELDVLVNDEREVRLVERLGLNLQEVRVIDMERTINYDVHDALFKYVELFNKERFCCPVSPHVGVSNHSFIPRRDYAPMLGASTFSAHGAGSWTTPFTGFPQAGGQHQNQPRAFKLLGNFLIEKIYCCLPQPLWMK